ncbi:hypothetical protein UG55_1027120 [Frankia sp. EI5c]|uniref:hypothetical protein n=1 Tax=Frankia sp. EI5c TaxID=683316 RepID=UPI0007C3FE93|nr:hypothetical protein [Frankia sp. EI5c]OAA25012.1 hypothetical protein UG55_1027120 [Frankia sp. EI5c]
MLVETTALGFLYGPTLVLLAVSVLVAVGRLTSGSVPGRPESGAPTDSAPTDSAPADSPPADSPPAGGEPDFGLLVPVATVPGEQAAQLRAALRAHGVRATLGPAASASGRPSGFAPGGRAHVLVFAGDLPRARRALRQAWDDR